MDEKHPLIVKWCAAYSLPDKELQEELSKWKFPDPLPDCAAPPLPKRQKCVIQKPEDAH